MLLGVLPASLAPVVALRGLVTSVAWSRSWVPGTRVAVWGCARDSIFPACSPLSGLSASSKGLKECFGRWRCAGDTISPACSPPSIISYYYYYLLHPFQHYAGVVEKSSGGEGVLGMPPLPCGLSALNWGLGEEDG